MRFWGEGPKKRGVKGLISATLGFPFPSGGGGRGDLQGKAPDNFGDPLTTSGAGNFRESLRLPRRGGGISEARGSNLSYGMCVWGGGVVCVR